MFQGIKEKRIKFQKQFKVLREKQEDVWSSKMPVRYNTSDLRNYYEAFVCGKEQRKRKNRPA